MCGAEYAERRTGTTPYSAASRLPLSRPSTHRPAREMDRARCNSVPPEGLEIGVAPSFHYSVATQVSAGWYHTCALRQDTGTAECWGSDTDGQSSPPVDTVYSQARDSSVRGGEG